MHFKCKLRPLKFWKKQALGTKEKNKKKIEVMAKALLEFETIDSNQINDIMAGKKVRPPKPSRGTTPKARPKDGGSGTVTPITAPQPTAKK